MAMLQTWIENHPTGQETGEYLGLELSGSLVHIYLVKFNGRGHVSIVKQQKHNLTDDLKTNSLPYLLEYLANTVDEFLTFSGRNDNSNSNNTEQGPLALGLALSFPLVQTAINKASVANWTKTFHVSDYEKKNVVELLQTALNRKSLPVKVVAVVNGASASLLANGYRSLDTLLSCTISNGTNAAYWEKVNVIEKLGRTAEPDENETVVNTEWGSFGDDDRSVLPLSMYDNRVNRQSENPGEQTFEKMVAGQYLGELVRIIIIEFMDRRILLDGKYTKELNTPYSFDISYVGRICQDEEEGLEITGHILEDILGLPSTSLNERQVVKYICELVGQRAARLVGAAISTIIDKCHGLNDVVTISIEGIIYESFPKFPRRLTEALRRIYGNENLNKINIMVTKDGNGIGAALAALLATTNK
ncbi:unnamed protein product [Cunninghamella echinulata]